MSVEPEPFYSKEMHDNHVLALARVTRERDDAQIALKASKLIAEIAEEGLVRWKREADDARAEIARLTQALLKAKQFIENGTELGYIRLPDPPDSALETLPLIIAALKPDTGE